MSIVLVDRCTVRAASSVVLAAHVKYISDAKHPDHTGKKKKTILPAKNYNTPGSDQSPKGFICAVIHLNDAYFRCRQGKRGKRSRRLFEEIVYRSSHGAFLTNDERAEIEARIIDRIGRMAVCRTAWHVDERTGSSDLHVLISAKNLEFPVRLTLWSEFGGSDGDHFYAWMDSLDSEITHNLNKSPKRQKVRLKSARQRHREDAFAVIGNQMPLAVELARYFKKKKTDAEEPDAEAIVKALKDLGHEVARPPKRSISIQFKGRKKRRRYNLNNLIDGIGMELDRLRERHKHNPLPGTDTEPEMN